MEKLLSSLLEPSEECFEESPSLDTLYYNSRLYWNSRSSVAQGGSGQQDQPSDRREITKDEEKPEGAGVKNESG